MHSIIDLLNSRGTASYITQNEHQSTTQPRLTIYPNTSQTKHEVKQQVVLTNCTQYQSDQVRAHTTCRAHVLHPPRVTALKTHSASVTASLRNGDHPTKYPRAHHTRIIPKSPQCHTIESTGVGLIPLSVSHCSTCLLQSAARTSQTGALFLYTITRINAKSANKPTSALQPSISC
jgi:hypothetical protein